MSTHHTSEITGRSDRIADPGLEPHIERYTDANPALGDRAARVITSLFGLIVPLLSIAFLVVYFAVDRNAWLNLGFMRVGAQHFLLGLCAGLGLLAVGIGLVHWAKQIMSDTEMIEERHPVASDDAARKDFAAKWDAGVADSRVARRPLLLASLGGAGLLLLPAVVTLADLGPWPTSSRRQQTLMKTLWAEGVRLVKDVTYEPIKADELEVGVLVNAQPANLAELHHSDPVRFQQEKSKSSLIVVRIDPSDLTIPPSRADWHVDGIMAYSKICTHVGCPVSLYEQQTKHLLCPCHQSTFDLADSGVVVFGPAARSLPQLPISVDAEGCLVARRDFEVPVGPSYFERDSRQDFKKGDR